MAALALPIREMSASVTIDAAKTQKKCLDVAESTQQSGILTALKEWVMVRFVDVCFDKLIGSQRNLIVQLQALDTRDFSADSFNVLASELGNLAATTFAVIDLANQIQKYSEEWRPKLDVIAEFAAHVDNFAESYRIAADEVCTSLLASMVDSITAPAAAPVH